MAFSLSSSSTSTKRSINNVEATKEEISSKKKMISEHNQFQIKIINMFKDADLTAPTELLGK